MTTYRLPPNGLSCDPPEKETGYRRESQEGSARVGITFLTLESPLTAIQMYPLQSKKKQVCGVNPRKMPALLF